MKLKIKVKALTDGCIPTIVANGDWIDLRASEDVVLNGPYSSVKSKKGGESTRKVVFPVTYIPLGVAIKLPKGFEAIVAPRSSTNAKFNILQRNSIGVIDETYSGDNDQWMMPALTTGEAKINKGDRICQFRIQLSQKATVWQKLKWLFSNGVEIVVVESLNSTNRGGLGSSGVK